MFQTAELDQLRLRKELLVLQCDTRRMLLATEFRRLHSPEFWWTEVGTVACKHPWLTASLGLGAGFIAMQLLRRPGAMLGWLSRLGGASSTLWSVWKSFRGAGRQR